MINRVDEHTAHIIAQLVDTYGPAKVLWAISEHCDYRGEHLDRVWLNKSGSAPWRRLASRLQKAAIDYRKLGINIE